MKLTEKPPSQNQNIDTDPQHHETRWATFTYCGKEERRIVRVFKDT
jgi:hypothetical protein